MAVALAGLIGVTGVLYANQDITVVNQTGHAVDVYLFQDSHPHLDPAGGLQFGHLANGQSAVAHVPNCEFAILLVDHSDIWHAEFHDCHSDTITFTSSTGHARR